MTIANSKRGSILVTVLFLISVLALLVATVAQDSMQTLKTVGQSGRDSQAKYAAYAGLEQVMNKLRRAPDGTIFIGEQLSNDRHGHLQGALKKLDKVSYDVEIWNNLRKTSGEALNPIDAPPDVKVEVDTVYMIASGNDATSGQDVLLSSMAGTARRIRPVFEDAAYARSKLIATGHCLVDAWDSEGWKEYVYGGFPDDPSSTPTPSNQGGGGGGNSPPPPNTEDYKATLGTDAQDSRTLRLLGDSKLNGHFRIGPGTTEATAFSPDQGTPTSDGPVYGVTTALNPTTQVAGVKDTGAGADPNDAFKLDDKKTDMPSFRAPYQSNDLLPKPSIANSWTQVDKINEWTGQPVLNPDGSRVKVPAPPAPVQLEPGGYTSIDVPSDQTLELKAGVYYFHEEMKVSGKITVTGSTPVVIFVGKKATFHNAEINSKGKTTSLQLCFTDEMQDELEIDAMLPDLIPFFDDVLPTIDPDTGLPLGPIAASPAELVKNTVAPIIPASAGMPAGREGASLLEITGGNFTGSVSGKNLVAKTYGAEIYGAIMGNIIKASDSKLHQDLALKGSNLMTAGGWELEGVHQLR